MRPRRLFLVCVVAGWVGILLASVNRDGHESGGPAPGPDQTDRGPQAAAAVESPPGDPARQAAYVQIVSALDRVREAAVKKFGREPRPDDTASFTIPYKVFVDGQTRQARKQLAIDLQLGEPAIDEIKDEGDRAGWPRK
jgi:hypothetical protein